MKDLLLLNPENATEAEVASYAKREASRAVIFDNDGKVALLDVTKKHYYKLPGGGLESGEDALTALKRECLEETGCRITDIKEMGMIEEYRKMYAIHQISYCYVAKLDGEKGIPSFVDDEIDDGFQCIWVSYDEALKLIQSSHSTTIEGSHYIVPRDIAILREAKNYSGNPIL